MTRIVLQLETEGAEAGGAVAPFVTACQGAALTLGLGPLRVRTDADADAPVFSVVVPAYNEAEVLGAFHARLRAAMELLGESFEIIYVNDGSTDMTVATIERLRQTDAQTVLVSLSRNFGKEVATTAGLDYARGAAVIVINADLQDPPELIPQLAAAWRGGADMVYAQRRARAGESWIKRTTADGFYRLMQGVGAGAAAARCG